MTTKASSMNTSSAIHVDDAERQDNQAERVNSALAGKAWWGKKRCGTGPGKCAGCAKSRSGFWGRFRSGSACLMETESAENMNDGRSAPVLKK